MAGFVKAFFQRFGALLTFWLLAGWLLVSADLITPLQLLASFFLGVPLLAAWFDSALDLSERTAAWVTVAHELGLDYRLLGQPFTTNLMVSGRHNGRELSITVARHGQGQLPSSRIELRLHTQTPIALRIWGPAERANAPHDGGSLFEATKTQRFGRKNPFFVRSTPQPLADRLYANPVWDQLRHFTLPTNIQIEGNKLSLEQAGIWQNPDAILSMVQLLEEMGEVVEKWETGWVSWHKLKPALA